MAAFRCREDIQAASRLPVCGLFRYKSKESHPNSDPVSRQRLLARESIVPRNPKDNSTSTIEQQEEEGAERPVHKPQPYQEVYHQLCSSSSHDPGHGSNHHNHYRLPVPVFFEVLPSPFTFQVPSMFPVLQSRSEFYTSMFPILQSSSKFHTSSFPIQAHCVPNSIPPSPIAFYYWSETTPDTYNCIPFAQSRCAVVPSF